MSDIGLSALNGGETYDLNDGVGVRLLAWDGLSLENVRRLSQRTAAQRGRTDVGYDQAERVIGLEWGIWGNDLPDYHAKRRILEAAMYPRSDEPIKLVFTLPSGEVRAARGHLNGSLEMSKNARVWKFHRVTAQVVCGDPRLYDPQPQRVLFAPLAEAQGWAVPWAIPWAIGASQAAGSFVLDYVAGETTAAPEYPIITLTGPMQSPKIFNETTGQVIDMSRGAGLTIDAGQTVVIDLKRGIYGDDAPTIRTGTGVSVEQYLTTDSNINEWHLAPGGEPLPSGGWASGQNRIVLVATGGSTQSTIQMDYFDRYLGI